MMSEMTFLSSLREYDKDNIHPGIMQKIRKEYVSNAGMHLSFDMTYDVTFDVKCDMIYDITYNKTYSMTYDIRYDMK